MSPDVRTFQALQTSSVILHNSPEELYLSQDDASEAERINKMHGGYGEILTDEKIREFNLEGFGVDFSGIDKP